MDVSTMLFDPFLIWMIFSHIGKHQIPTHSFQFKEERTNNKTYSRENHIQEKIKLTMVHFNKDGMDNA